MFVFAHGQIYAEPAPHSKITGYDDCAKFQPNIMHLNLNTTHLKKNCQVLHFYIPKLIFIYKI